MLAAIPSFGQMRWGVEAGLNLSHGFDTSETKAGFNAGVTGEYAFSEHWFADAALKLSSQPSADKYTIHYGAEPGGQSQASGVENSFTPYYLTLPVRIGCGFGLSDRVRLTVAAGPAIGVGLFGTGKVTLSHNSQVTSIDKFNNVFSGGKGSWSRFEYGFNVRAAVELCKNYKIGLEYSLMHLSGNVRPVDNVGIFSVNLGYKF